MKKKPAFLSLPILFLVLAGIISFSMTALPIMKGAFFFTFDQARDAIWVKNQVDFLQPSLIGPWGSLNGVFFGPLWFWLLTLPYLLSGGDPTALTLFNTVFVFLTVFIAGQLIKRHSPRTAYFFLLLSFLSLQIHIIASTAFSQHMLPLFTFLLIYFLTQLLLTSKSVFLYMAVLFAALLFHAEPPLFLFSLPIIAGITLRTHKKQPFLTVKTLIIAGVFLAIPLLPTLLFDLRHDFLQFKALMAYVQGDNPSLGDVLPFWQRLSDRPTTFFLLFRQTVINQPFFALIILCFSFFVHWRHQQQTFIHTLISIAHIYIGSLLVIFAVYPPELKLFYLDGISVLFLLFTSSVISHFWNGKIYKKLLIALCLLIAFWINRKPVEFFQSWKDNFSGYQKDTSIFRTQMGIVDGIYTDAAGKGFRVYTYQPAVYDYPYQYLFLWHGINRYGYLPEDFSYLPGKPEYVQKKFEQLIRLSDKLRPAEGLLYLIIEPGQYEDRTLSWLTNFSHGQYPLLDERQLPDGTRVEKRQL